MKKAKGPVAPLEVVFLGHEAEQIRAMAAKIGMPAATLVRIAALNCSDEKALIAARKMFSPKTVERIISFGERRAATIAKGIETRSKLKLVKGGKK
jgi:hypothetical protein